MKALPRIHLNGTSAEELYRQAEEMAEAARTALAKTRAMAPNGRDYGTALDLQVAQDEHWKIVGAFQDGIGLAEEVMEHASPYVDRERAKRRKRAEASDG